jgi:hypothetical protein
MAWGILLPVALWCAGCAASAPKGRVIVQQGESGKAELLVRVDRARGGGPFDHPAAIPAERLTAILSAVKVQWYAGLLSTIFSKDPHPAFGEAEAALLGPHLSRALADAGPDEVAVFYLSAPETGEQARITSGGLFVKGSELTVTLANYHYVISWSDHATNRIPGSASTARDSPLTPYPEGEYRLIPGPGQQLAGGDPSTMGRLFGKPSRSLVVALGTATPAEPPAAPAPEAAVAPTAPQPSTLEEKLRTLKKLRDDGLISEADYEAKKQELLKGF